MTIVVCGSSGRTADVTETVDGVASVFFAPNRFLNMMVAALLLLMLLLQCIYQCFDNNVLAQRAAPVLVQSARSPPVSRFSGSGSEQDSPITPSLFYLGTGKRGVDHSKKSIE